MKTVNTIPILRRMIADWKQQNLTIAFIPTMGNLHRGHLALVEAAHKKADKVVVSIFVNPSQFSANEDFTTYPRTEKQDRQLLMNNQVDCLFLPTTEEIYHSHIKTQVIVSDLSDLHCGKARQGHFLGVTTVVCKLINVVQSDYLFLGKKDFQQLTLIQLMVRDLNIPIQIESVNTVREQSGLAMSSRNGYLTTEQQKTAPQLYQSLCSARNLIIKQQHSFTQIEHQQEGYLTQLGFEVDYFSICCQETLIPALRKDKKLVILVAATLGKPRLIDNLCLNIERTIVASFNRLTTNI